MHAKNTNEKWGWVAQLFHIVMAGIILTLYYMAYVLMEQPAPAKYAWYDPHKSLGVTVLFLVLLRLTWRHFNVIPSDPKSMPKWQSMAAKANIVLLYFFMIAFPLSGIGMNMIGGHPISYFGLFTIHPWGTSWTPTAQLLRDLHTVFAYGLGFCVSLHIGAGLYHHFFLKDNVLRRMFDWR